MVAAAPDVIIANSSPVLSQLRKQSTTLPMVCGDQTLKEAAPAVKRIQSCSICRPPHAEALLQPTHLAGDLSSIVTMP